MKKGKTLLARFSIAQKVIAGLTNVMKQEVIDITDLKKAKVRAEELETTITLRY